MEAFLNSILLYIIFNVKYKLLFLCFFLIFFLRCDKNSLPDNSNNYDTNQYILLQNLKKELIEDSSNNEVIQKKILGLNNDSLKNNLLFEITYYYYDKDSLKFRYWINETYKLSKKLHDTSKLGESNWYLANFFYKRNLSDSSYFYYNKAYNYYKSIGYNSQTASMLYNMALLQKDIKDLVGSEVTTIAAIEKFKPLNLNSELYAGYNNLGIINNELQDYDKAIEYHTKAFDYLEDLNNPILKASSYNNLGVIYLNKKDYKKSLNYFDKALSIDSVYLKNPRLYAMLLDNMAYSKLKQEDTTGLESEFNKALGIRDSIQHVAGIITNHIHLSEFYLFQHDTSEALKNLHVAKSLSEKHRSYSDLLESLLILARIENDKSNEYYKSYINLSDSLQIEERVTRNKFARIRYETDEYISENKYLNIKNRNMLWLIISIISIFTIIFIIRNQKIKFDKLKMANLQQAANEEIYNLLLVSQNKLDEGRENEKKRISKELHDGILSKFFGVRLNLEILNDSIDIKSIKERQDYIQELKLLENEIRGVSHQLNEDMSFLDNNFIKILKELFQTQGKIGNFHFNLDIDETIVWEEISNKIKINIYRIVQEGIHNINKYSDANFVQLILLMKNFRLKIELEDNGVGFDLNSISEGIGLSNMKSRIGDLSGEIKFYSDKSGTKISIEIPIKNT